MQYSERLRSDGNEVSSPGISYEQPDEMELDPELLAIQQSINVKQLHDKPDRNSNAKVEIKVIIIRHPEAEASIKAEKPMKFIVRAVNI